MANPIIVNKDLPADNPDVLSGSILDPVPGPGTLVIYIASSQRDGVLTIGGGASGGGGAYKVAPVLRANGIPDLAADTPFVVAVQAGKLLIDYDEVAAGDAFATIMFIPD